MRLVAISIIESRAGIALTSASPFLSCLNILLGQRKQRTRRWLKISEGRTKSETKKRFLPPVGLLELAVQPAGFSLLPDDLPRESATRTSFWHFAAQRLLNI